MKTFRISARASIVAALAAAGIALSAAAPATAAPVTVPFQLQTFILADLATPQITATVGAEPGVATLAAVNTNPTAGATAGPIGVRWISLGTGVSGYASFAAGSPAPVVIRPGVGQVVALIEGGLYPGFGTFYVQ